MTTKTSTTIPDDQAEPAWEIALLFPAQGEWSEDDYLRLTDHTRHLVEFRDGRIEVVRLPTDEHQRIVLFLYRALYAFLATQAIGIVLVAPLRLRLQTGRYREPDLMVLLAADDSGQGLILSWKWSVLTTRSVTWGGNARNTREQEFPNIGSSTRRLSRLSCCA